MVIELGIKLAIIGKLSDNVFYKSLGFDIVSKAISEKN